MLIKSAIATQMSGSIGGMTAGHNKGGMYLRGRGMIPNPNTGRQIAVRNAVTELVQRWTQSLDDEQRAVWDTYGKNVLLTNRLGDPLQLSGQNHYVRSNTPRVQSGLPIIDDGPGLFNLGDTGSLSITEIDLNLPAFNIAVGGGPDWAADDEGSLIVYMGLPQSAGRNFFRGPWRLVTEEGGNTQTPVTSVAIALTSLPFPISEGQRVWFYARASNQDGRLSSRTQIGPITITDSSV